MITIVDMKTHCHRCAFTLIELLVVIAIIGLLMAMLLPAIQKVRAAADRMSCSSNMRQIGIALHHYHNDYNTLPASGWTVANSSNPSGKYVGWRAVLTPYIEQDSIRAKYDRNVHWWEEPNLTLSSTPIKIYLCPSTPDRLMVMSAIAKPPRPAIIFPQPAAAADYEAVMGVHSSINPTLYGTAATNRSAMFRNSQVKLPHIYDGTHTTILIAETAGRPLTYRGRMARPDIPNDQGICWADSEGGYSLDGSNLDGSVQGQGPVLTPRGMNATNYNEPYAFHPNGANFLFADGHVQFIDERVSLVVLAALFTRNAGEPLSSDDY